jgi:phosphatidylglycerophosphate synthase
MQKKLIDDQFYQLADFLNPYFYNMGFTPNMLTFLSLIFVILSTFMFYKDYRIVAFIFYLISYYYDCADGNMARKYNMVSNYGDFLDHFTDLVGVILLFIVFYIKNKKTLIKIIPIIIVLILISANSEGCNVLIKERNNGFKSKTLNFTKHFCLTTSPTFHYFFNTSTCAVIISIIILFYK